MVQDAQSLHASLPGDAELHSRQRLWRWIALAFLTGVCLLGLLALVRLTPQNGYAAEKNPKSPLESRFRGWAKPDLAIVFTGEQYGYLQPCGCSHPQYGGLVRRYNFLRSLKGKGWPLIAFDLGDVAQKSSPQRDLKYATALKAMKLMHYAAVGVGKKELDMPFFNALGQYALNDPQPPLLAANIRFKAGEFDNLFHAWRIVKSRGNAPAVGVIGLVGKNVATKVDDPDIAFHKNNAALFTQIMAGFQGKVDLTVLLYYGSLADAKVAAKYYQGTIRRAHPQLPILDVILCISPTDNPPSTPYTIPGVPTSIITVGHKGRYVGVVGAFRTGLRQRPYRLKYQLVSIGPEFETPAGRETSNPIMALMEEYAANVKQNDFILKYPTVPHRVQVAYPKAKYRGDSKRCAGCHPHAVAVWKNSAHSHAFDTLVKEKHPSLRQYDGECVQCHVVGFHHPTGYTDALRAGNKTMIKRLRHVGCESCHGPISEHLKNTRDPKIHAVINPWKATPEELNPATAPARKAALRKRRRLKIDQFCQKCHDTENDVHWDFDKRWPKVAHMTPKKKFANKRPQKNVHPGGNTQPANDVQPQVPVFVPQPAVGNPPSVFDPNRQFPPNFDPNRQFPNPYAPGGYPPSSGTNRFPSQQMQNPQNPTILQRLNPFRWFRRR